MDKYEEAIRFHGVLLREYEDAMNDAGTGSAREKLLERRAGYFTLAIEALREKQQREKERREDE